MNCFDNAPEFFKEDNRRFRAKNPVTKEMLYNKHIALLPQEVVKGKTILDLGCCIGATGHWCLSNGATHYTGVELQTEYADIAHKLLGKYHPGKFKIDVMAIEEWLDNFAGQSFDVVCLLGVIYTFVDYYSVLKKVTSMTGSTVAFDARHPYTQRLQPDFCGVTFIENQSINISTEASSLLGRGTNISPRGLAWLMRGFGFRTTGTIKPEPITGSPDVYNLKLKEMTETSPARYLMRFERSGATVQSLSENLKQGVGKKELWVE